jgi:hypothetical protein
MTEKARESENVSADFRSLYRRTKELLHSSTDYLRTVTSIQEANGLGGARRTGNVYDYYFVNVMYDSYTPIVSTLRQLYNLI